MVSMGENRKNAVLSNRGKGKYHNPKRLPVISGPFKKVDQEAGKMGQRLKAPAMQAWQSEVNPWNPRKGLREKQFPEVALWPPGAHLCACLYMTMVIFKRKKSKSGKKA